jgi:hypothetical protein
MARKFLAGRILEVPLIILQYYKPSFSLYIYIYKERRIMIFSYQCKINLFYFTCGGVWCNQRQPKIANFF